MDAILDTTWDYIAAAFLFLGDSFFRFLEMFHVLGPVVVIGMLAVLTVTVTKTLNRFIITGRYRELEKEYQHWFNLRQETMRIEDTEKGRRMARNIDQAELNKAYYDYFFEGFLLNIVRKVIPILFMFGFINEYYTTADMVSAFGQGFVFAMPTTSGEPLLVGAAFWYILCLLGCYIGWPLAKMGIGRMRAKNTADGKSMRSDKTGQELQHQP